MKQKNNLQFLQKPGLQFMLCFMVMLLALLPSVLGKFNLSFFRDQMGDMATPSALAGLDWTSLIARTSYYGYGLKWIYFFLFKVTDNYSLIVLGIKGIQVVFICLVGTCFYRTLVKHVLKGKNSIYLLLCVLMALYNSTVSFNSEGHIFLACFLLLTICMECIYAEKVVDRILWSIGCAFWLCFMIAIHERCISVTIAFFFVLIVDWFINRKCMVQPVAFGISFTLFTILENKITSYIVSYFWSEKLVEGTLKNTSVAVNNPTWFLKSIEGFRTCMEFVFTNFLTFVVHSYGLGLIACIITIYCFILMIVKRREAIGFIKENRSLLVILFISLLATVIIIAGVAVRWGKTAFGGTLNGYKGMTYSRYYQVFFWPAFAVTLLLWDKIRTEISMTVKIITLILTIAMFKIFATIYIPFYRSNLLLSLERFVFYSNWSKDTEVKLVLSVLFTLVVVGLLLFEKSSFARRGILILLIVINFWGWKVTEPKVYSDFEDVYSNMKKLEQMIELPSEIYYPMYEEYPTYNEPVYQLQFILNKYPLRLDWPEESGIALASASIEEIGNRYAITQSVAKISMGNGMYLYVQGDALIEYFENSGVELIRL